MATFAPSASANIPANANTATTAQLTAPANKNTNNFGSAFISDDTNPLPSVNLTANQYTEVEWCIAANASITAGVYTFRVTSNGTALNTYSANATWTLGASAAVSQTIAAITPSITGTVAVNGTVAQTLAALTPAITGTVAVTAVVQQGLAGATLTATATVPVVGVVSQTLGSVTASSTGTVSVSGTVTHTLGAVTIESTGTVVTSGEISATVDQTLGAVAITSTGTVSVSAVVTQTLGAVTPMATSTVSVSGTVSHTLGVVTQTVTGTVSVVGEVTQTLGAVTIEATGTVASSGDISATISQTLAAVALASTGTVSVSGTVAQTLNSTSIVATGTTGGITTAIQLAASSYIAANAATNTTGQLTAPANKTVEGYFQSGKISDDTNPLPSVDLVIDTYSECEWAITATNAAIQSGTYSFRVTANGTVLTTYAATPTMIVLNAANATVAQTLNAATLVATAQLDDTGTALVTQTLLPLGQSITGSTGRAAEVNVTLGSVSQPKLFCETEDLGGGTPTGFNFYFGRAAGTPTQIVSYPYSADLEILLTLVAPDVGEWYVSVSAYNADGETVRSNEVFVVVPTFTVTVADVSGLAVVAQTLGPCALAAAAKVAVTGTVTQTLAAVSTTSTGTTSVSGVVSQTLGQVTRSLTGTVSVSGDVAQTLGSVGCAATATASFSETDAVVSQTLGAVTIQATGSVHDAGSATAWVDALLGEVHASMSAEVDVTADVTQTLLPVTHSSHTHVGVSPYCPGTVVYYEEDVLCHS